MSRWYPATPNLLLDGLDLCGTAIFLHTKQALLDVSQSEDMITFFFLSFAFFFQFLVDEVFNLTKL